MAKYVFDPDKDIGDLAGKVIFVTGGTAGLGAQTITALAKHNPAKIYFSGRNAESADALTRRVREAGSTTQLSFIQCDLGDLAAVKSTAEGVLAGADRLDVLVANAGVMGERPALTKDGRYEVAFGTNHVGHALLIRKLLPLMERTVAASPSSDVRIVVLTSFAYTLAGTGLDLGAARTPYRMPVYGPWFRYGQSKLANLLYARALSRRLEGKGILVVACHPGVVGTGFVADQSAVNRFIIELGRVFNRWPALTPEQGALNQIWLATAPRDQIKSGALYEPVGVVSKHLNKTAVDDKLADKLWEWTEEELKEF